MSRSPSFRLPLFRPRDPSPFPPGHVAAVRRRYEEQLGWTREAEVRECARRLRRLGLFAIADLVEKVEKVEADSAQIPRGIARGLPRKEPHIVVPPTLPESTDSARNRGPAA